MPLETPGCPSSGLEAPLASQALEASLDFRVLLVLMASRATPDLKERRAWWVPEDNRDLQDKREKRVSVASTHTGCCLSSIQCGWLHPQSLKGGPSRGNKARLASKALQGPQGPRDQAALWDTQDCQGLSGHLVYLGLLDQRETPGSRATMAARESGACQGCQASMEPRGLLGLPWLG